MAPAERARIGVASLRRFLEVLLRERYMASVPALVPLLERELRCVGERLAATKADLSGLRLDQLKVRCSAAARGVREKGGRGRAGAS